ncbi:MAG: hypothetical protein DI629_13070 [Mesorhizobium amorphae]|nr:MAG: hypothetical protein DI629_13070 [Mesorhizobium amorphae]
MKQLMAGCLSGMVGGLLISSQSMVPGVAQAQNVSRVQAPFHVVNAEGTVLAEIDESLYGAIVQLKSNDGHWLRMGGGPDGMTIAMSGAAGSRLQMSMGDELSSLVMTRGGSDLRMTLDGKAAPRIQLRQGEVDRMVLGGTAGGNVAMTVNNEAGQMAVQAGSDKATGSGKVLTGDSKGQVNAYLSSGTQAGQGQIGIKIQGNEVATIHANQNGTGGLLSLGTTSGEIMFKAGVGTDNMGGACVQTSKGGTCMSAFRLIP